MVNKVILIGNCGADTELRTLPSGASYARVNIATNESYKDKDGEWQTDTEWHSLIFWRQQAKRAEKYLKKGVRVYVEGKLKTSSWDDESGNKRSKTEVQVLTFKILDKVEHTPQPASESASSSEFSEDDDDVPF